MVAILLGNGFEPLEAVAPCDILRRGGVEARFVSIHTQRLVEAGHGMRIEADCTLNELNDDDIEMVMLPGGLRGVESILASEKALSLVQTVYDRGGHVSAICAAPTILARLGLTEGKRATCYPGMEPEMGGARMQDAGAVRDGKILTGRAAGSAEEFGLMLLAALKGEAAAKQVAQAIVYTR